MRVALGLGLVVGLVGCALNAPYRIRFSATSPSESQRAAADAFYRAESPSALRAAAAEVSRLAPNSALAHEVQARLAQLEGREADVITHLSEALLDAENDAAPLHLHWLMANDFTFAERARVKAVLFELVERHPSPHTQALARHLLAWLVHTEGDLSGRDELVAGIEGSLPFAVVGTWDNDQGKGFDLEFDPEKSSALTDVYPGRTGPLRWRAEPPLDPRGRLDLGALMTPNRWSAAFAQAKLTVPSDGAYQLRLTTTDPLKVWVDGSLVFATAQLERTVFDQLILPLALKAGEHTVLIKSAHRDGNWLLSGRLVKGSSEDRLATRLEDVLALHVRALPEGARTSYHRWAWAHLAAGGSAGVKAADTLVRDLPGSVIARAAHIDALWFNQERGRAADALAALDVEVGEELVHVRLRNLRFLQQQGLKQRARSGVLQLIQTKPHVRETWELLLDAYRSEGWLEDELRTVRAMSARFELTPDEWAEYARAQLRFGNREQAISLYRGILDALPRHGEVLRRLADLALEAGDSDEAEALMMDRVESWPTDFSGWLQLAEIRRRAKDLPGAIQALDAAQGLSPDSSLPVLRRGDLAYAEDRKTEALTHWRRALDLNPENEALANRIEFLAPEQRGPWMADIPSEEHLSAVVSSRAKVKQMPGADVAWLLDHEVTLLNSDGSTSNVVTLIAHAFNAQGRDRLIRQSIGGGRFRLLQAYCVDERGQRTEASSERNRQIFFRGMQPGATLVLQYRLDIPPQGFLARYFTQSWSFQSLSEQRVRAEYVLWAPQTVTLHEVVQGPVQRSEDRRGDQQRIRWLARDVAPLVGEPSMPGVAELAASLRISTIPEWKVWLSWQQALLEGAFRDSPEIDELAKVLGQGAPSSEEKLKRIHQFVMEEIRYQQDYESFIAGVKPHAAPMVLERRYGDCKDKAVLFIELANKLGLEAHFALVRTREAGPVLQSVPMQQFNHAIVYVPEQADVSSRFFDPTAELLDLDAVRTDDVGTMSLVFDPKTGAHTWREISYQAPEQNRERLVLDLALDATGGATGQLTLEGVGRDGSTLRRASRNEVVLTQLMQRVVAQYIPGASSQNARSVEVKSLRAPAVIAADVSSASFARPEGETLRVKLPSTWNPRSMFTLTKREHPMLLGTPTVLQTDIALTVPDALEVKKAPASQTIEMPCFSWKRTVTVEGAKLKSVQQFRSTCERMTAAAYLEHRAKLDEVVRWLDDELVLGPKGPAPKTAKPMPGKKSAAR